MKKEKVKKAKKVLTADQKKGKMFLTLAGIALILTPFTGASEVLAGIGIYHLTKGDEEERRYKEMCKATGQMTAEELETKESEEDDEENTDNGELE